jgi:adenosine deaminase
VTLSTDDPAMFHTNLMGEYSLGLQLGLDSGHLVRIAEMGFESAFLPPDEKQVLLEAFRAKTKSVGLI